MKPGRLRAAALLAGALLLLSAALSLSYWPGVMTWDSIRQYGQALSGRFDDWHPPLMNWIWRRLLPLGRGPAPMLLLQLGLAFTGYGLLAGWALRAKRPALAVALAAASLLPVAAAEMASVVKDALMAGLLLSAAGLLARRKEGRERLLSLIAFALIALACALRFNAFPAGAPLLAALLPERLRSTPLKAAAAGLAAAALLLLPMPLANRLLHAEPSGVGLSLITYDLGGISEHSGRDAFPPLPVQDPVAANHRCYSPVRWDPYADWAEETCPVGFAALRPAFAARGTSPTLFWARAVLAHPLAYARHRLAHFNANARFLLRRPFERPVHDRSEDNPWGFQVTPNPLLRAVDALALASDATPLGWPIVWMALALGVLLVARRLPSRAVVTPLALSSLLYGLGYAAVSVASDIRYHLWTMIAALLAACIAVADLSSSGAGRTPRLLVLAAPAILASALGAAARLGL